MYKNVVPRGTRKPKEKRKGSRSRSSPHVGIENKLRSGLGMFFVRNETKRVVFSILFYLILLIVFPSLSGTHKKKVALPFFSSSCTLVVPFVQLPTRISKGLASYQVVIGAGLGGGGSDESVQAQDESHFCSVSSGCHVCRPW